MNAFLLEAVKIWTCHLSVSQWEGSLPGTKDGETECQTIEQFHRQPRKNHRPCFTPIVVWGLSSPVVAVGCWYEIRPSFPTKKHMYTKTAPKAALKNGAVGHVVKTECSCFDWLWQLRKINNNNGRSISANFTPALPCVYKDTLLPAENNWRQ